MGLSPFKSCDSAVYTRNPSEAVAPNPDPSRWEIVYHKQVGNCLVVKVHYIDCTNYEGMKVMVYSDMTIETLKSLGRLDPHFDDKNAKYSPIARFCPSQDGLKLAIAFAEMIKNLRSLQQKFASSWS